MLNQLRMRIQKLFSQSRYVIEIGRSRILEKHLRWIQLEECGFGYIIKPGNDDSKGRLSLLGFFT